MPGERETKDEPIDALYRACKRYEELHAKRSPALDHAWTIVVMYYCQRVRDGDYLPAPDEDSILMASDMDEDSIILNDSGDKLKDEGEEDSGWIDDAGALYWIGRLMNEIERRRNLRGRGASSGTAIV